MDRYARLRAQRRLMNQKLRRETEQERRRENVQRSLDQLPAEIRERVLKAATDFRTLTPEERASYWGKQLSPAEREIIRAQLLLADKGVTIWSKPLSPEERERIRAQLLFADYFGGIQGSG